MKKIYNNIKNWLNASDINSELGANILISIIRWFLVSVAIVSLIMIILL